VNGFRTVQPNQPREKFENFFKTYSEEGTGTSGQKWRYQQGATEQKHKE
jgi:hypothetical protein